MDKKDPNDKKLMPDDVDDKEFVNQLNKLVNVQKKSKEVKPNKKGNLSDAAQKEYLKFQIKLDGFFVKYQKDSQVNEILYRSVKKSEKKKENKILEKESEMQNNLKNLLKKKENEKNEDIQSFELPDDINQDESKEK